MLPDYIEWKQLWLVLCHIFRRWEVFLVLFQQFREHLVFVVELFEVDVAWHKRDLKALKQSGLRNLLVLVDCQEMDQVVVHVLPYLRFGKLFPCGFLPVCKLPLKLLIVLIQYSVVKAQLLILALKPLYLLSEVV